MSAPELFSDRLKRYFVPTCVGSTPTDSPNRIINLNFIIMETKDYLLRCIVYYVLSMFLGILVSWVYCGAELMFVALYYLVRAIWYDVTHD